MLIILLVPPFIERQHDTDELEVTVEDSITLVCESEAIPPAEIRWMKMGQTYEVPDHVQLVNNDQHLRIMRAQVHFSIHSYSIQSAL